MFGLAYWPNYHYYRGHVMWDVEAFAFPVLLLTAPATARALLSYRVERLPAARRNAAMHGYGGLQFPWESSPLAGDEVYRVNAPELGFEQHVSFSTALAFARFVQVLPLVFLYLLAARLCRLLGCGRAVAALVRKCLRSGEKATA